MKGIKGLRDKGIQKKWFNFHKCDLKDFQRSAEKQRKKKKLNDLNDTTLFLQNIAALLDDSSDTFLY